MAATVSGTEDYERFAHSRVMSPCSVKNIEKKLRKLSAQCVWKPKQSDNKLIKESFTGDSKERTPGEMIGLRQQCQIAFSPHYGVCPSKDYFRGVDLCHRIWCKDRTKKRSEPCETRSYLPALDGTECGKMKVSKLIFSTSALTILYYIAATEAEFGSLSINTADNRA
ncbi:unnamed protein product [Cylicostephanus goldi]|uniref:ADAMTS cysteine-rich domain-containing protein n=1 Tax=Cylicostephanus goldi TaxID=71465 RepID=A0A3P6UV97_CYLGO|nr:unnamed protein product [Cylicostephanus goldi]